MDWTSYYIGLPYERLGRSRSGVDCWGLIRLIMKEQKEIDLPLYGTVDPSDAILANDAIAQGKQEVVWKQIGLEEAQEFDCVIMRQPVMIDGKWVSKDCHVGIVGPRNQILHVQENGSAVAQGIDTLKHRIVEILRHKEI